MHKTPGRNRRAMWIAAILVSAAAGASAQADSLLGPALHYFTRHHAGELFELFDSVRPAPVSDAEQKRILATLPMEGDVCDLDSAQLRKLAAVGRVLELHHREAVYVIKVMNIIDVPQAIATNVSPFATQREAECPTDLLHLLLAELRDPSPD